MKIDNKHQGNICYCLEKLKMGLFNFLAFLYGKINSLLSRNECTRKLYHARVIYDFCHAYSCTIVVFHFNSLYISAVSTSFRSLLYIRSQFLPSSKQTSSLPHNNNKWLQKNEEKGSKIENKNKKQMHASTRICHFYDS
jgi:hypothetical protein